MYKLYIIFLKFHALPIFTRFAAVFHTTVKRPSSPRTQVGGALRKFGLHWHQCCKTIQITRYGFSFTEDVSNRCVKQGMNEKCVPGRLSVVKTTRYIKILSVRPLLVHLNHLKQLHFMLHMTTVFNCTLSTRMFQGTHMSPAEAG